MGSSIESLIEQYMEEILQLLDVDLTDENIKDTPKRVAKYLIEFLVNWDDGNTDTLFESIQVDQMVIVKDIPFWSLCQHHLLPFKGKVSVGYLTGTKVLGLSKIPRIVQRHAHKLQLQEKLAHDIADDLGQLLSDSSGIGVFITAEHSCMQMRGIRTEGQMLTSVLRGVFRQNPEVKQEFLMLVK